MYKVYDSWPDLAEESYESNLIQIDFKNIDHVIFAGMGGSGAIGDICSSILSKTNVHVSVIKGYLLPKTVDSNTLVVATSVSGNTAETLTILDSARKTNCKVISFSSGGRMLDYCLKNNLEHRNVQQIHSQRASLPLFLYSILKVLETIIPVKGTDITESIDELKNLKEKICSTNLSDENPSLELAKWISGLPLIYYPVGLQAAAIRFKSCLQENAKSHVIVEDVIESCHNGIVAWEKPSDVKPILLEGENDYIKTKERWKIIKEYFEANKIDYREVFSIKGNILSKLINLIYLLDYCTIYLAVSSKIDPTPVKSISFVKNKLGNI